MTQRARAIIAAFPLLVGVCLAPSASAFDPYPWAKDDIQTCIYANSFWTQQKKDEVNAAVAAWENQIEGSNIYHDPNPSSCPTSIVEINWVTHLNGKLAKTAYGSSGPIYIVFAKKVSASGANIPWSFDGTVASDEFDFRSTAIHELGHALGLHHPEHDAEYPFKSWDGQVPTMKKESAVKGSTNRRTLKQDDRAGGWWSATYDLGERQYSPRPGNRSYWTSVGGSLTDCGSGYYCLNKNSNSSESYMYKTTRLTTNQAYNRSTPKIEVRWRLPGSQQSNTKHIKLRFRKNSVGKNGSLGGYEYQWSSSCFDSNATSSWETCTFTFGGSPYYTVQDMRVYVYNRTGGTIHIAHVKFFDG